MTEKQKETKRKQEGRTEQKIAEKPEEQENGSNGLGEVPAPQFIHTYTQLQIQFVYSIDRKNGDKIIKPKT